MNTDHPLLVVVPHANFSVSSASFYTYDNFSRAYFSGSNAVHPYLNSDNGVYFGGQDRISYNLEVPYYNFHSAYITVWPYIKGKFNVNARTHLTHTWSSAKFSVSSVTSAGVFSFGVTNSDKMYQGYSDTTYIVN